jgi:hypothetical protein
MDNRGIEVRFLEWTNAFLCSTTHRPGLDATNFSIQWVTGALYLEVKRPGREANYSLSFSADNNNNNNNNNNNGITLPLQRMHP